MEIYFTEKQQDKTTMPESLCKLGIYHFYINCIERVALILMLAIILIMTVRYTDNSDKKLKNKLMQHMPLSPSHNKNTDNDMLTEISMLDEERE